MYIRTPDVCISSPAGEERDTIRCSLFREHERGNISRELGILRRTTGERKRERKRIEKEREREKKRDKKGQEREKEKEGKRKEEKKKSIPLTPKRGMVLVSFALRYPRLYDRIIPYPHIHTFLLVTEPSNRGLPPSSLSK